MANNQGRPRPRKTLTEFDPVTFPIAESALVDSCAAYLEANVSGSEVPNATKVIAVTAGLSPSTHPNNDAYSPTTITIRPIMKSDIPKAAHPPQILAGGTKPKKTFQKMHKKCINASNPVISSTFPSSSIYGANIQPVLNYEHQVFSSYYFISSRIYSIPFIF